MKIYFDIPFFLTTLTLLAGGVGLLELSYLAKRRPENSPKPWWVDYAVSLFPVLLTVLLVRSFLVQPYRVPSGSLMPTIMPGDFILVKQYSYGLRLPVLNSKVLNIGAPKVGDLVLFRYPPDPRRIFIKRVIGVPGDHVVCQDKQLILNGRPVEQTFVGRTLDVSGRPILPATWKIEWLPEKAHYIYLKDYNIAPEVDLIVPPGNYFVLGDNRDSSNDSRMWGMVPDRYLVGKAFAIWFSWDPILHKVRFSRIGTSLCYPVKKQNMAGINE